MPEKKKNQLNTGFTKPKVKITKERPSSDFEIKDMGRKELMTEHQQNVNTYYRNKDKREAITGASTMEGYDYNRDGSKKTFTIEKGPAKKGGNSKAVESIVNFNSALKSYGSKHPLKMYNKKK